MVRSTTSYFVGKGKKTCCQIWDKYPDISNVFLKIMLGGELESNDIEIIERYIVILLYCYTTKPVIRIPSISADLNCFQLATEILKIYHPLLLPSYNILKDLSFKQKFGIKFSKKTDYPNPDDFGWKEIDSEYIPVWSELPEILESCRELVSCGCKKGCTSRCKCKKENLPCSHLCKCFGKCQVKD